MKITRLFCIIAAFAMIAGTFFCTASAKDEFSSFYAPDDVQEALYEQIMKSGSQGLSTNLSVYHLSVVKGSAAPLYDFDLEKFAETGNIVLTPLKSSENDDTVVYSVKVLTKNGEDAGCILVDRVNGEAHQRLHYFSQAYADQVGMGSENNKSFWLSLSYADQAERIRLMFGLHEIISPDNVKLTFIKGYGPAFYIKTDDIEAIVPVGRSSYGSASSSGGISYYTKESLRPLVQKYVEENKEQQAKIDDYFKEHPDAKVYPYSGGTQGVSVIGAFDGNIENVTDVKAYFEKKASASGTQLLTSASPVETTGAAGKNTDAVWLTAVVACAVTACAAVTVFALKKRKSK